MYKRSDPIKSLHSVQNHMANVYSSKVCLQTKNFPKISKFFFFPKNTPKYDKLSKISNISIKTILKLWTKFGNFGNFGNFGHILDRLRTIHNTCSNLIGSEPLYILPTAKVKTGTLVPKIFIDCPARSQLTCRPCHRVTRLKAKGSLENKQVSGSYNMIRHCLLSWDDRIGWKDQLINKNAYFYYFGQFRVFL